MAHFQNGTVLHKAKRVSSAVAVLYLLLLTLLTFGLRQIGEGHPLLAALLYLPPACLLLPALPIFAILIWSRPRLLGIFVPSIIGLSVLLFQFNLPKNHGDKHPQPALLELTVHSFNLGQSGNTSQEAFVSQYQPDLLAVQEVSVSGRFKLLHAPYASYPYAAHIGEFALFSQHPIVEREILLGRSGPIAARCLLNIKGQMICVYLIHLKSPRRALRATLDWPWLHPIAGNSQTKHLFHFWTNQQQDAIHLARLYESENLPCVVLGDTNAPPLGKIHRRLTQKFSDIHERLNWGCGFTFPGDSPFLLSNYGPWVRLDKVLVNDRWKPIYLVVEPELPSQHRALMAKLALLP